jgi:formylglycine-generating enzyme required for sulfatase activity
VGSFPDGASPYGALDMAGNAWEWVADHYHRRAYAKAASEDPTPRDWGMFRTVRGGSWHDDPEDLRATERARRFQSGPFNRYLFVGVRCVRTSP